MSDFSAAHQVDRPAGEAAGSARSGLDVQLVDAVREQPCRVIIFDEIEKAHPLFYDRLLQILEDGRLTDSRGTSGDFSHSVIVAVTNLGISVHDHARRETVPLVSPEMPYPELEAAVRSSVRDYFGQAIARPEVLNRLDGNLVVFDFIRPDLLRTVFRHQLTNVVHRLHDEYGVELVFTLEATEALWTMCVVSGVPSARDVGNLVEANLINPLARSLFELDCPPGSRLIVEDVMRRPDAEVELGITVTPPDVNRSPT